MVKRSHWANFIFFWFLHFFSGRRLATRPIEEEDDVEDDCTCHAWTDYASWG